MYQHVTLFPCWYMPGVYRLVRGFWSNTWYRLGLHVIKQADTSWCTCWYHCVVQAGIML